MWVTKHKLPVVQLQSIGWNIYIQEMVEGHLHKVILTFFIGKLLGE